MKYLLDESGHISALSKQVVGGLGEAVGINYVSAEDREVAHEDLAAAGDQDYFEKGIEDAIALEGMRARAGTGATSSSAATAAPPERAPRARCSCSATSWATTPGRPPSWGSCGSWRAPRPGPSPTRARRRC
ncbi:hypothetical protein HLB09_14380 [Pseudokineococcus marinus]|uniref:Uncharacterized protein n=1 Tax=Pseudokineococcus marinus TaxID=351215 RepID=A0A849BRU0_9ACTN|nr:hypothetical protein [Pseudokineococcus marinus]